MSNDPIKAAESRGVGIGMCIAAAIIADHSPTYAREILGAAALETVAEMRALGVDDYDIKKLRFVIRDIAASRRWHRRHTGFAAIDRLAA